MISSYNGDYYTSRGFFDEAVVRYARKEKLFNLQWASRWAERDLLKGEGRRALDAGCGVGHNAFLLRELGYRVTAADASDYAIQRARERAVQTGTSGVEWRVVDFDRDRLPGEFDLVICWEVIEHVRDPRAVLEKLYGALAPGGVLVITTPNAFGLTHLLGPCDPTHISVHSSLFWAREARRLRPSRMRCRSLMFWDHVFPWLRGRESVLVTWVPIFGFRVRLAITR